MMIGTYLVSDSQSSGVSGADTHGPTGHRDARVAVGRLHLPLLPLEQVRPRVGQLGAPESSKWEKLGHFNYLSIEKLKNAVLF